MTEEHQAPITEAPTPTTIPTAVKQIPGVWVVVGWLLFILLYFILMAHVAFFSVLPIMADESYENDLLGMLGVVVFLAPFGVYHLVNKKVPATIAISLGIALIVFIISCMNVHPYAV